MRIIIGFFLCCSLLLANIPAICNAQSYKETIRTFVHRIAEGKSDSVASKLPSLEQKYPQSPGVLYIEGLITSDGTEAIHYFTMVADSFPHNPWAADALARMVEVFRATGESTNAAQQFERLHSEYPQSPYITSQYLTRASSGDENAPPHQNIANEYAIQIGAFGVKQNAERMQKKLILGGFKAEIFENLLDGKNLLYLVWIGSYTSAEAAQKDIAEIKEKFNISGVLRPRTAWKKW